MLLLLYLGLVFLATFIVGKMLQEFRISWLLGGLLAGALLSPTMLQDAFLTHETFVILAELGMYFLLFIIGFEISFPELRRQGSDVLHITLAVMITESLAGSILIHYLFGTSWMVALLVATSFATVGEALLVPILDEFHKLKTRASQLLLSVGVLDDAFELVTVIIASVLIGKSVGYSASDIWLTLLILGGLSFLTIMLVRANKRLPSLPFKERPTLFLFVLSVILIFIGIGDSVGAGALGALLAGIALQGVLRDEELNIAREEIKMICYGFFAPVFFFSVGISMNVQSIFTNLPAVIAVILVATGAKLVPTVLLTRKKLGYRGGFLVGVGLLVKLSTSLVVLTLLAQNNFISEELYSTLVAASIVFTLAVPIIFSVMIKKDETLEPASL